MIIKLDSNLVLVALGFMLLSTVQVASCKKIPKEIKKINKALDLPPKSTFMWDLLSIYKMKEDILKNKADIAKYHPNTTVSTITTTKTITTTTTTTTTFGQSGLILLTTGRTLVPSDSAASEVVNVLDSSSTCQSIPDYPVAVHQASGGILDNVPVVCGGGSDDHGMQSTCYKLDKNTVQWTSLTDAFPAMNRFYATPYNGTLFISGGRGEGSGASADKAETLFLSLDGTIKNGPNLPTTRRDHCSVELHDGRAIIMGSDKWTHQDANTVLFYDPIADNFVEGPPMNSDRTTGACTLFHSPMHDNRPIVLALGGYAGVTAEILDYSTVGAGWEYIGDLPNDFNVDSGAGAFAVTSKDGQGAYVQHRTNLFELTCTTNDCTWTTMPTKFSNDLKWGVAMHLAEDWDGLCS